jgi:hypothetical protein
MNDMMSFHQPSSATVLLYSKLRPFVYSSPTGRVILSSQIARSVTYFHGDYGFRYKVLNVESTLL